MAPCVVIEWMLGRASVNIKCRLLNNQLTKMQLDLNLLTALDALLDTGSVQGAALRLHVTSPAVSRTLARLRDATGDPILVRTGRHMTATPYAMAIREEVHALVQQGNALLSPRRELDLTLLHRVFTVQCHDAVSLAFGNTLTLRLLSQAPLVKLRLLAEQVADSNELRHGQIDLEIGSGTATAAEIRHETLAHDHLVVAMRKGHALARQTLTIPRYAGAQHLIVSRRGRLRDPVDDLLARHGRQRQVVASAPGVMMALLAVRRSELIVAVSKRACHEAVGMLGLTTKPLPLKVPPVPLNVSWHRRYDGDAAHAWLRSQVREVAAEVFS
jgi:DNA-binding transcriptional LysR family regulator